MGYNIAKPIQKREMKDLEKKIDEKVDRQVSLEIFSIDHDGKRYWVKRSRATGSGAMHRFGYAILKMSIMAPAARKSRQEAQRFEAEKLERLYECGIAVPKVVIKKDDYFVMEDRGESLAPILKHSGAKETDALTGKTVASLGTLHKKGFYHGASQIRNFTRHSDGEIYIIDFEESFSQNVDIKSLQLRDLFLLLYSLHRQRCEIDYKKLIEEYMRFSGNNDFASELRKIYKKLSLPAKLLKNDKIRRMLGSDAEILHRLFESIS